jgi:BirA family biotin operon repressor/biotin-[acetyl-CoA-carboxylase] ligase
VALAFSIILRPGEGEAARTGRLAGLGALAVAEACDKIGLETAIKWPNDVLVRRRKIAGILAELQWSGESPEASVLGIGINVLRGSPPPQEETAFPATNIEAELGLAPDRFEILGAAMSALVAWRRRMHTPEFIRAWESRLAFLGEQVHLIRDGQETIAGAVLGLESNGGLRMLAQGQEIQVPVGELHLHPTDDRIG